MKPLLLLISIYFTTALLPVAAQIPVLNSYPSAQATVFIDFDGQYVAGTAWNMSGPIDAAPAGFSAAAITEILNRVAEDFRPFNLNITTDSARYWSAPANKRMRIIVTPSSAWYGAAGGVAYAGSFIWGDNTPAWVFSALLGNRTKWVAEAISHETGHTLGLQHQSAYNSSCVKTAEYSVGQGSGEIGWAPIMGAGYYQNHTTWNIGANTIGCSTIQNDFDIISTRNGFGLRPDDHGNSNATASAIAVMADAFTINGLVNTDNDVDVFKLVVPATTWLKLNAIPHNVGAGDDGANIDIQVSLLNGSDTINTYNPSTLLNAGVDTNLNAGTYYLVVDGAGNIYHNDVGSLGLYTISGNLMSTLLPVQQLGFTGAIINNRHQLTWNLPDNQSAEQWILEFSAGGKQFSQLAILPAATTTYTWQPTAAAATYYRLKMIAADGRVAVSNTILLQNPRELSAGVQLLNHARGQLAVQSDGEFLYSLYIVNGQLLSRGTLHQGVNYLPGNSIKGLLLLQCSNGKQSFTKKIIQQ